MPCAGVCHAWKNMMNFIKGIPKYAIGSKCHRCNVWFPKNTILRCPCCGFMLRIKRRKYNDMRWIRQYKSNEEIAEIIEYHIREKGWQPVKLEVFKRIKDYEIMLARQTMLKNET